MNTTTVYEATALVPERFRSTLRTWVSGTNRLGMLVVRESFACESCAEARDAMCRLLVPLGVSIAQVDARRVEHDRLGYAERMQGVE